MLISAHANHQIRERSASGGAAGELFGLVEGQHNDI